MQHRLVLSFIISGLFCSLLFLSQCTQPDSNSNTTSQPSSSTQPEQQAQPELADYMGQLQYFTHKFALSVAAENADAADFYFHEVRALTDVIKEEVPGYEGYDIARFLEIFLEPEIEPVSSALAAGDWQDTRSKLISLIDACNTCHRATSHGFIQVTPGFDKNPYNQVFNDQ